MTIDAKICGLATAEAVDAAAAGGARYIGLNFYPKTPRYVAPAVAAGLAARCPERVGKVGLFVDAPDDYIAGVLAEVRLDVLQLHGGEPPDRVAAIRRRFGLPVMKAVKIADAADVANAETYEPVADMLLFDAKPPAAMTDALPGGNALAFDWRLLAGRTWRVPWLLSGGLHAENVAAAVRATGAAAVDVSSGVESAPGAKEPAKIRAFLAAVQGI